MSADVPQGAHPIGIATGDLHPHAARDQGPGNGLPDFHCRPSVYDGLAVCVPISPASLPSGEYTVPACRTGHQLATRGGSR